MSGGLEVNLTALRAASQEIRGTGERLSQEVRSLEGSVTGSGSPWGGDEAGTVFGMAYTEVLGHALDVYASMAEQLADVAERLGAGADNHERTDSGNAQLFTRLGLPGGPATPR